jgi:hypothetical protein
MLLSAAECCLGPFATFLGPSAGESFAAGIPLYGARVQYAKGLVSEICAAKPCKTHMENLLVDF